MRRVVTGALEVERAQKRIGSSLQAHPIVYTSKTYIDEMANLDCAEIVITSDVTMIDDPAPFNAFVLEDIDDIIEEQLKESCTPNPKS